MERNKAKLRGGPQVCTVEDAKFINGCSNGDAQYIKIGTIRVPERNQEFITTTWRKKKSTEGEEVERRKDLAIK